MEHELGFTALLNNFLPGVATLIRSLPATLWGLPGWAAENPNRPWTNFMAMEILGLLVLMLFPLLVFKWSVDKPGKLQQIYEVIYEFFHDQAKDVVGHDGPKHIVMFGTIFLFVLVMNLVGMVPGLEAPTMFWPVPVGVALATFVYYNFFGFKVQGPVNYLKHFAGPVWWLSWFLFPIEIISHMIRPVSLSIRLGANMLAGEQVTNSFLNMAPYVVPTIFMGLHLFVSFLQAFIFMVLAMAYVGGAVEHEHEEGHGAEAH
jgi:F-type H+-transporting ATPase subunit a